MLSALRCFLRPEQRRQVRIMGPVKKVSAEASPSRYFAQRPEEHPRSARSHHRKAQ